MADIVLVNPKFNISYWGLEYAMPFFGKRANLPVAALPLLAALTPSEHHVTLVDENVEDIDYDRLAKADLVGVTGMTVQRFRMREILVELKRRGVFAVVGGPWITVQEDYFGDLADVIFIGEAEETWPKFLADWTNGRHQRRYEQVERTDMSLVPTPRFDLLKMRHYLFGSVQFSRGCPFQCEFCDIIVTFGRRPRLKTTQQVVAELEALRKQRIDTVFIVDDNLIGNKRAIKVLLRALISYQEANGYPFEFFTEASLDLAEDEELMELMVTANINQVFVGIESPNEKSLRETRKFQNVRPAQSILDRVRHIQKAGIEVWCGMILGFDHDDVDIFDAQVRFIQNARIISAMIGMLSAIPKTPLHARLAHEGRLDTSDVSEFGTNVIPAGMRREELRDGFVDVMKKLYDPEAYFSRLDDLYICERLAYARGISKYWQNHPFVRLRDLIDDLVGSSVLFFRLMRLIPEAALRRVYRQRFWRFVKTRPNTRLGLIYLIKCAIHYHLYALTRNMVEGRSAVYNTF
jgi:radical SAM superfamily enzyme YgiQ (UPF0313 family)